jgi:hypothetical protein
VNELLNAHHVTGTFLGSKPEIGSFEWNPSLGRKKTTTHRDGFRITVKPHRKFNKEPQEGVATLDGAESRLSSPSDKCKVNVSGAKSSWGRRPEICSATREVRNHSVCHL